MHEEYAEALRTIIEAGASPKGAVKSLHKALSTRGRLALLPRIARAFSRISSRIESRDGIVLDVSRKSDLRTALKEAFSTLKEMNIKPKDVKVRVNADIIGGWRLEGREMLRDASYKKQLLDIYGNISEK